MQVKGRCPWTFPYLRSYSSRFFFISSLSLSHSLFRSVSVTFCFLLTSSNGRQMEAGRGRTSRFPGSPALSLLSQYQVDRVPLRTFVLTFLASSSSCHLSLSLSLSLSVTFLLHVNRCNGRQMEAGSRQTSQFPGSSALSLLSQYQVDCVPFRTFVLTFLASSSSSCHLCLFLSLYVTFLFHVNRCKWKANGSGKKKNESVPRLSCT